MSVHQAVVGDLSQNNRTSCQFFDVPFFERYLQWKQLRLSLLDLSRLILFHCFG